MKPPSTPNEWAHLPVTIPHELCHYITARLLGLKVRFAWDRVYISAAVDWRLYVVTLAPAMAGLVVWAGVMSFAIQKSSLLLIAIVSGWLFFWLLHCWRDFYCVGFMWRHRRLPKDAEGPQKIPLIGV